MGRTTRISILLPTGLCSTNLFSILTNLTDVSESNVVVISMKNHSHQFNTLSGKENYLFFIFDGVVKTLHLLRCCEFSIITTYHSTPR